jgi:hypothetical protein
MDAMSWREETSELDPTELGWRWFVRWKVEVRVVRNVRGNKARRAPRTGGGSKITLYIHSNTSLPTEAGARRACSAEDWEQEQVQTSESHPRCWFPRRCPCLWTGFAVGVPSMIMHEDAIYNLVFHLALRRRPESGLEICQRQRHPLGRRRRGTHLILVS